MKNLTIYRQEIDIVDDQLYALLAKRIQLSRDTQTFKVSLGISTFDPKREGEILAKAPTLETREVMSKILEVCKREQ